jgi:hypothetical protein
VRQSQSDRSPGLVPLIASRSVSKGSNKVAVTFILLGMMITKQTPLLTTCSRERQRAYQHGSEIGWHPAKGVFSTTAQHYEPRWLSELAEMTGGIIPPPAALERQSDKLDPEIGLKNLA